ncbi:BZ3500_MvSof-1268-A1-R1_Chr1-1g00919 [Microbotryum saponariae]|uniref:BZ3500_MvSof-1268-A1-R1_Chr1-1g00919 protein n=1 Tax=Microbotryum saponariae TaxID=289078 RepID=A0A2X0K8S7_9BASI|nr:BZ3500_MvSof-1268-A1-R1_Chr1-1g00919 [Microbotryum saponariae]SCZ92937.1 BZ3501_MvSof-1269-A2-R1_Chr1-1g00516 [Microbotryum saponariae]
MTRSATRYLVLTFASFDALHPSVTSPQSYVPHIRRAATRSCTSSSSSEETLLVIVIRTKTKDTRFPWSTTTTGNTSQGSTSCSSSSASASASSPHPSSYGWSILQPLLSVCYSTATRVFIDHDQCTRRVHVVVEEMRGIPVCLPNPPQDDESESNLVIKCDIEPTPMEQTLRDDLGSDHAEKEDYYPVVALGGTFDHLHAGHKILLTLAASLALRKLIVGVTGGVSFFHIVLLGKEVVLIQNRATRADTQLLTTKKYHQFLEPIEQRIQTTRDFLEWVRPGIEHHIVPIQDPYGPTATEADIQAIVVSEETRAGGQAVNKKRLEASFNELDIWVIELMADEPEASENASKGPKVEVESKMGSTAIRKWLSEKAGQTKT